MAAADGLRTMVSVGLLREQVIKPIHRPHFVDRRWGINILWVNGNHAHVKSMGSISDVDAGTA